MRIVLAIYLAILSATVASAGDDRIWFDDTTVNGKPVTMVFDSGCSTAALTAKAVGRLGLTVTVRPTKKPGDTAVYAVDFDGHSIQTDFGIINFPPDADSDFDGLLGWSPICSDILRIDAPALRLTFLSKVPAGVESWTKLSVDTNYGVLVLKIPGQNSILIDTGDPDGITLSPRDWERWKKAHRRNPITLGVFGTIYGTDVSEESWADQIQIGPLTFNDVPIKEEGRDMVKAGVGGDKDFVGLTALRRLDLVVDGIHNVAYLRMRQTPPPPYAYNRLGAVFIPAGWHSKRLVARVAADSPAFQAGVRNGDTLLQINGTSVSLTNGSEDPGFGPPAGTKLQMTLRRHRKIIEATATLRNILPPSHRQYVSKDYSIGDPEFDAETIYGHCLLELSRGETNAALSNCIEAIRIDPNFASGYVLRGYIEWDGDVDAALADYNKAINLGLRTANIFDGRAILEEDKTNVTAALADYSKAIDMDPDWAELYCYRGWLEQTNGDLKGAYADYSKVIALEPAWAPYYYGYRAQVEQQEGNLAGAEGDSAESAKLNPNLATNAGPEFVALGYLRYDRQQFANALSDFNKACELNHTDGFGYIGTWLCDSRLGQVQAANTELQAWLSGGTAENTNDWASEIARFLIGQVSESDFLKAAEADSDKDKERYCEACFYAGTKRLIDGDKAAAGTYFKKSLSTGAKCSEEYQSAKVNLRILNDKN